MSTTLGPARDLDSATRPEDDLPPGERYYRHPGDVLELVLWGAVAAVLSVFLAAGSATADGVTADIGRVVGRIGLPARELGLGLLQLVAVVVPVVVVVGLVVHQRWRRLGIVALAAAAGSATWLVLDGLLDLPGRLPDALTTGTWVASTRFPSPGYLAGAAAVVMVGKPWLARSWRRAADIGMVALVVVTAVAGTAGVPALLLAVAAGGAVGAGLLVVFGAPNRRPTPAVVAASLAGAGVEVSALRLQRAEGGRAQLYLAETGDGERPIFVKVYGRDSRDADLLYRGYRALLLRDPGDGGPTGSLKQDVEHEALLTMLAHDGGVSCPGVETLTALPDGSVALALEHVVGRQLDALGPDEIDDGLLDATWRQVLRLHEHRIAHRALRAGNVLVAAGAPVIIDLGFADESASPRLLAIDRAELLTSLATLVGVDRAVAAATRTLPSEDLAATAAYLQPLALSATTRRQAPKPLLAELRASVDVATGAEPVALERLIRVRPRTIVMITVLVGAFYLLLPQLANVDDSFEALRHANWAWLLLAAALSAFTYVASAIGIIGGVRQDLPLGPTVQTQLASSFVNRVTPANVGGMALNVRYLQKAGVDPKEAVAGVGLNSIAGAIVHVGLLVLFFAWAGQGSGTTFQIPSGSKVLVAFAVVLAVIGIAAATTRGRRLVQKHVVGFLRQALASVTMLAKSPTKLAALFGGSAGVTLAYAVALYASVSAVHGGLSFAQVGAVSLGAALIAAAAPTPGGLGALEAALVAGLTGVGMEPGAAVAAVLSYRLVTFWLPIIPGWISFHMLERRGLI